MGRISSRLLDEIVELATTDSTAHFHAAQLISDIIAADHVLFSVVDLVTPNVSLTDELHPRSPEWNAAARLLPEVIHPAMPSYLDNPENRSPRRLSDVVTRSEWVASRSYREIFKAGHAEYQLSMVITLNPPTLVRGWILTRSSNDFTDRDLELASMILPSLIVADQRQPAEGSDRSDAHADQPHLSDTEIRVLQALAEGWTAARIAFSLDISPRTVGKHLENAYRKLGCNDRLLATLRAKAFGLI